MVLKNCAILPFSNPAGWMSYGLDELSTDFPQTKIKAGGWSLPERLLNYKGNFLFFDQTT